MQNQTSMKEGNHICNCNLDKESRADRDNMEEESRAGKGSMEKKERKQKKATAQVKR